MKAITAALSLARRTLRRSVHVMLVGFNRSTLHDDRTLPVRSCFIAPTRMVVTGSLTWPTVQVLRDSASLGSILGGRNDSLNVFSAVQCDCGGE